MKSTPTRGVKQFLKPDTYKQSEAAHRRRARESRVAKSEWREPSIRYCLFAIRPLARRYAAPGRWGMKPPMPVCFSIAVAEEAV